MGDEVNEYIQAIATQKRLEEQYIDKVVEVILSDPTRGSIWGSESDKKSLTQYLKEVLEKDSCIISGLLIALETHLDR